MIVQTYNQQQQSIFKLSQRPVYFKPLPNNHLSFALTNQSIQIINLNKLQSQSLKTGHTKRINMIKTYQDNILLTCSNDGGVKLWDLRQNYKNIATLKRGYEVYSITMDDNRLISGSSSRITFWDLRTNKQMKSYQQSFDGDVTDLELRGNKIYSCATDGMVVCIDTQIEIEQDAAEWQHRVEHAAQSLKLDGNYVTIGTTDHVLIVLNEDIEQKKIEINSPDEPRHLLWYEYQGGVFDYIVWNLNEEKVERWDGERIREVAYGVSDVDFVEKVNENVFGVSGDGEVMNLKFEKNKEKVKSIELKEDEEEEEIIKPKYNKINKKKLYNPL